jgi:cytochrome bd-type quinol oxidase subunit 2
MPSVRPTPVEIRTSDQPRPIADGFFPMAAVYSLWIAFAAECVLVLVLLRAPVENLVAAFFAYRNRSQVELRFRFEASYLLVEILIGVALFALTIIAEYRFRTTSAWAHTYQRPFYPELLRRFFVMAFIPACAVILGLVADQFVLRLA